MWIEGHLTPQNLRTRCLHRKPIYPHHTDDKNAENLAGLQQWYEIAVRQLRLIAAADYCIALKLDKSDTFQRQQILEKITKGVESVPPNEESKFTTRQGKPSSLTEDISSKFGLLFRGWQQGSIDLRELRKQLFTEAIALKKKLRNAQVERISNIDVPSLCMRLRVYEDFVGYRATAQYCEENGVVDEKLQTRVLDILIRNRDRGLNF